MKKNTQEAIHFLKKAYSSTSYDDSLDEVRHLIKFAIAKLEHVEIKREKRQDNYEKRKINKNGIPNPIATIRAIDEEINKTKSSIQEMRNKRADKSKNMKDEDDNEFQTVFG